MCVEIVDAIKLVAILAAGCFIFWVIIRSASEVK